MHITAGCYFFPSGSLILRFISVPFFSGLCLSVCRSSDLWFRTPFYRFVPTIFCYPISLLPNKFCFFFCCALQFRLSLCFRCLCQLFSFPSCCFIFSILYHSSRRFICSLCSLLSLFTILFCSFFLSIFSHYSARYFNFVHHLCVFSFYLIWFVHPFISFNFLFCLFGISN